MPNNYTTIPTSSPIDATVFNTALTELDNAIKKNKYDATTAPTSVADAAHGYSVGSRWVDVTNDRAYVCVDATTNAAIWKEISTPASPTFTNLTATGDLAVTGDAVLATGTSKKVYIHDSANANQTVGLTINMGGASDEILSLKSGSVSHDMTSLTEADTFGLFKKVSAAPGGLQMEGFSTATVALSLYGRSTTEDTAAASSSSAGIVRVNATKSNGAGTAGAMSANAKLFTILANGSTKFIFDNEGDSFEDGTGWTAYDAHDDIALLNTINTAMLKAQDPVRQDFWWWVKDNAAMLRELGIVSFNPDGHHFINRSKMQELLVGAVRQLGARLDRLEAQAQG